jgi:hypothetical protein
MTPDARNTWREAARLAEIAADNPVWSTADLAVHFRCLAEMREVRRASLALLAALFATGVLAGVSLAVLISGMAAV